MRSVYDKIISDYHMGQVQAGEEVSNSNNTKVSSISEDCHAHRIDKYLLLFAILFGQCSNLQWIIDSCLCSVNCRASGLFANTAGTIPERLHLLTQLKVMERKKHLKMWHAPGQANKSIKQTFRLFVANEN